MAKKECEPLKEAYENLSAAAAKIKKLWDDCEKAADPSAECVALSEAATVMESLESDIQIVRNAASVCGLPDLGVIDSDLDMGGP